MEEHAQNLQIYLQNGGDVRIANRHQFPSLENRAKIAYLISNFPKTFQEVSNPEPEPVINNSEIPRQMMDSDGQTGPEHSKPKGLGIIAQYPAELHQTYKHAVQQWIEICSLKINLNKIERQEEKSAFEVQTNIIKLIELFDRNKAALDHYNEHKRIIATETKSDFSELSPIELLTKRNSLRSLITRRNQTIDKMAAELPEASEPDYYKKLSALNRKKEQLQELILDEEKLTELIK
ncbi:hypothetical protein [Epilithonimonas hominis]|uniref:hypothetical protein n=1 Tax=Epilithonimonas hominis TaxID=420404 RepID=UPI0028962FC7|nr:hypothetical protein [Epilithonimonas hominis]